MKQPLPKRLHKPPKPTESEHHDHHHPDPICELKELIMATAADLRTKLDAVLAAVQALKNAPQIITQAELDADAAKADEILAAATAPPTV